MSINDYIGGDRWEFSDKIYTNLTNIIVESNYNPTLSVSIKILPELIPGKEIFGLFWNTPTFKDIDSNYFFHVYDNKKFDYIISTSSGNTVEGMARIIQNYNQLCKKKMKAILLVPECSSYKVNCNVIENNQYIKYIVLKNSTLDDIREIASKINEKLKLKYKILIADADLKSAAYAQIGLVLNNNELLNDETCYVQTVSGGVGTVGVIESAYQLKKNPEILVVQPINGNSAPLVEGLNEHLKGKNPLSIFETKTFVPSCIEPTLGSTKPNYSLNKFINWRGQNGRIKSIGLTNKDILSTKNKILKILIKSGIYPNIELAMKYFELEKSGIMAFVGAFKNIRKIESHKLIINFTGRYIDPSMNFPISAKPHILYDPSKGISELIDFIDKE